MYLYTILKCTILQCFVLWRDMQFYILLQHMFSIVMGFACYSHCIFVIMYVMLYHTLMV